MSSDLHAARRILEEKGCTWALCKGDTVLESHSRGIRPLLELYKSGKDVAGFSAADKVVGKAAALLYCLLNVQALHAGVLSRDALRILENAGIAVSYDTLADAISNRKGDGLCPMELATRDIEDPLLAVAALEEALKKLS